MAASGFSKRLFASYVADWLAIIVLCVIIYLFNKIRPQHHDFSLLDLSISFPLRDDTVPFWVAIVVAGVVPAVVMPILVLVFVPSRSIWRATTKSRVFKLKLWEWHTAWLGLAMSLAVATVVTTGLKNFGKPRPNCLARCQPDVSKIQPNTVGGYATEFTPFWSIVTVAICTQTDQSVLDDGFMSWPSGHSSFSWAGLLYFALFLAAKFAVRLPSIPVLAQRWSSNSASANANRPEMMASASEARPMLSASPAEAPRDLELSNRDEAAAPPLYLIFAVLVPIAGAAYIAVSRWMDYAHHGFDVFSGSLIGIVSAWISFRWYNPALMSSSGWSWGPRSANRAFEIGVGVASFVDPSPEERYGNGRDVELGRLGREE